ncbi:MAG: hypothetical protein EOP88_13230 [Verrucomicrobiaceae bacterium]|nr:MAG: hypothetical protein EOP88_13230 [Verrucomicrobiaceae bacterium]
MMQEDPYVSPSNPPVAPPPLPSAGGLGDDAGMRMLMPVGRSGWAIAAGYLGLFSFVLIPAPLSMIVSAIAIRDIRRSRGTAKVKHGMGRAVFGLVAGVVGSILLAIISYSMATGK